MPYWGYQKNRGVLFRNGDTDKIKNEEKEPEHRR